RYPAQHGPDERGLPLTVCPWVEVVGDGDEAEPNLLRTGGASHHADRIELLAREVVADLHRRLGVLLGGRLPALAAGGLLLRRGAALRGVSTRARALATVLGGVRRVGDLRRPPLGHALVLQR